MSRGYSNKSIGLWQQFNYREWIRGRWAVRKLHGVSIKKWEWNKIIPIQCKNEAFSSYIFFPTNLPPISMHTVVVIYCWICGWYQPKTMGHALLQSVHQNNSSWSAPTAWDCPARRTLYWATHCLIESAAHWFWNPKLHTAIGLQCTIHTYCNTTAQPAFQSLVSFILYV